MLEVNNLVRHFVSKYGLFSRKTRIVHAVDGVSFNISEGENLGLVGESGCGKTTVGKLLLRLLEPKSGTVSFMGRNIFDFDKKELREFRRNTMIIFQDPLSSFNPRKTVRQILAQPFLIHGLARGNNVKLKLREMLETTGVSEIDHILNRYPHELSGGQRQRIAIARALALRPKFIVADEPVSALDVSIRAQILNLMKRLRRDLRLACLFITHDLSVVRSICDRVAVMYLGKIVELAEVKEIFRNPLHPYTKALLSATPVPNPKARTRKRIVLEGDPPSPVDLPLGCRLLPRCPWSQQGCEKEPELIPFREDHFVACYQQQ